MCMIRTHQNKIAVAVKRDIRTVARYKDTIREWSSAKCGTARRQQTRSATAAGSPSKHSGNPRSRFFFGFVGYLFFFWVLPLGILQIHSKTATKSLHSEITQKRALQNSHICAR